jgi:pimeloyl-ACP methyl ester carboxylesterase
MSIATIRGNPYHYLDRGAGEPVVLLHWYTGTWLDWQNTIPALSGRYRCIAPDQRGFGKSERLVRLQKIWHTLVLR